MSLVLLVISVTLFFVSFMLFVWGLWEDDAILASVGLLSILVNGFASYSNWMTYTLGM